MSQLVQEYEKPDAKTEAQHSEHCDQTQEAQKLFFERGEKLTSVLQEFGNPFQEASDDLFPYDTKDIASPDRAALVATHCKIGAGQCHAFLKTLESEVQCTFYQPVKNKADSFKTVAHST